MTPRNRDSSVGDMLGDRGPTVRCPKTVVQTGSWAHSTFYTMVSLPFCPGSEAAGAQSYHSSNAVPKKAWSYASITHGSMVRYLSACINFKDHVVLSVTHLRPKIWPSQILSKDPVSYTLFHSHEISRDGPIWQRIEPARSRTTAWYEIWPPATRHRQTSSLSWVWNRADV
jgi:hypothetical protein